MVNDNKIDYIDNLISVLQGRLVIGNQESISVYGNLEQQKLGELAKDITQLFLNQGYNIEITINNILDELKEFQVTPHKTGWALSFFEKSPPKSVLLGHYTSTLKYIEKLNVELKLQEAEILKESNVLERLEKQIERCGYDLQNCIDKGKTLILSHDKTQNTDSEDVEHWWIRLEQRVRDLELSYMVSMQTLSQVKLLKDNNNQIVNRILEITTKTIPLWKSQMKAFISIANSSDKEEINRRLGEELKLLSEIEIRDTDIRKELRNISS